ncbi:MAG: translation initiation factor IF-3 [Mycoplasma sp.]|nr:translation initiation factor IF-3 [Mycoplasma sp.]
MINNDIRFPSVFVIDETGAKLGVIRTKAAVEMAKERGFDLVVISKANNVPVAKILDYGKFKYNRSKKRKEAKTKQSVTKNREVRLTPLIGIADLKTKAKKAREFILDGDRVKVSLKFRGREMARQELGHETLKKFYAEVEDIAQIQLDAKLNGRFLDMYLTIDKKKAQQSKKKEVKEDAKNEN